MNARAGYSLFEVLIAFTVMTMVLAVLIPGQAEQLSRVEATKTHLLAQDYALSRLAALGVADPVVPGSRQENYGGWSVEWQIAPTTVPGLTEGGFAQVQIRIADHNGQTLFTTETLRELPQ